MVLWSPAEARQGFKIWSSTSGHCGPEGRGTVFLYAKDGKTKPESETPITAQALGKLVADSPMPARFTGLSCCGPSILVRTILCFLLTHWFQGKSGQLENSARWCAWESCFSPPIRPAKPRSVEQAMERLDWLAVPRGSRRDIKVIWCRFRPVSTNTNSLEHPLPCIGLVMPGHSLVIVLPSQPIILSFHVIRWSITWRRNPWGSRYSAGQNPSILLPNRE